MIIKRSLKKIATILIGAGLNPYYIVLSIVGIPRFLINYVKFKLRNRTSRINLFPMLCDRYAKAGVVSGHYFYQDLWAARKIFAENPPRHIDIGSRIDGFIGHLLSFREVTVIDIRKLESKIEGLMFVQMDISQLDKQNITLASSVSCLHALEHFGLGRYGDPINKDGHIQGLKSLSMLLTTGGKLYLSVPIGEERIEFDAHRIFNPQTIINLAIQNGLMLKSLSYINDDGEFYENVGLPDIPKLSYGCGLFEFKKDGAE